MDKKLKREIIIVTSFFIIVTGILLKVFTGFLGAPDFVYLYSYNNDTNNGFVRPDDVYEISLYSDYKNLKVAEYALKYCHNVNELSTYGDHFNNLNFLKNHQNIKKVELDGTCDDWSALSSITNLEYICFIDTNINDFSLISGNSNLKHLSFIAPKNSHNKQTELPCYFTYDDLKKLPEIKEIVIWGYIINNDILEALTRLNDNVSISLFGKYNDNIEKGTELINLFPDNVDASIKDGYISVN